VVEILLKDGTCKHNKDKFYDSAVFILTTITCYCYWHHCEFQFYIFWQYKHAVKAYVYAALTNTILAHIYCT